jgi:glycosyltransferase involved in cell wall biosynthesis
LRAAIQRLIDQPQERLRLGGNARRAYLEEYSLEAFADRAFLILKEAAG